MSYLAEVLQSVEKMELEQINTKLPEVVGATDLCKRNVLTYLENVYVKFRERPKQNKVLGTQLKQLQEESALLIKSAEEVTKKELVRGENEARGHLEQLKRTNYTLTILSSLCRIHDALMEIKSFRESEEYLACMERIKEIEDFINSFPEGESLVVLEELRLAVGTEKNSLLNRLLNVFRDNVILQPIENHRSVIRIKSENAVMDKVLTTLYFYKTSVTPLDNVTKFLWNNVFVPVVDCTTEIKTNVENDFAVIDIVTVDPNKKSSYVEVFANIKTILSFLSNNFNISLSDDLSTLSYIGRDIRDNLSELIIKHCLQDTIPSTKEGLLEYQIVIEATEDLEKALVMSKIFAEDTTSILEYANNIDVLFINKKCLDYSTEAQTLMRKDLHDLVEVGVAQEADTLKITTDFPRCSVSKSVLELLQLLENILIQAIAGSEKCAGRLLTTVQNICELYATFVPEHHKKLLQTIPQQIAVFYNNCHYISFQLTEWNGTYLSKLPSILRIKSFDDEGRRLREIASVMFTTYVEAQIRQIEETMKDAGLQKPTLDQIEGSTEKCLRQCLRQQELLKTVWHKVLPYTIYNKTVGAILSSLCDYVVTVLVKCEDISTDAAVQLVEMFKMVQTRGPKLFTDSKEVALFVTSWYRLNELVFVLNANLVDINDRWADGKGPLALQFKPEELKQLVRALFQNTERRAALLTKIHD